MVSEGEKCRGKKQFFKVFKCSALTAEGRVNTVHRFPAGMVSKTLLKMKNVCRQKLSAILQTLQVTLPLQPGVAWDKPGNENYIGIRRLQT